MNETAERFYHYTTGRKLAAILQSGVIRPAFSFAVTTQKPVVWCSTRKEWEPGVACRQSLPDGRIHYRTPHEIRGTEGGLARIRLKEGLRTLIPWEQYKEISQFSAQQAHSVSDFMAHCGAEPATWHASFLAIPASLWACVEVQHPENSCWVRCPVFHKKELCDLLLRLKADNPLMTAIKRQECLKLLGNLQKRLAKVTRAVSPVKPPPVFTIHYKPRPIAADDGKGAGK